MLPDAVVIAIFFALIGWFGTLIAIGGSQLSTLWKQLLLIPSWIPWAVLALGAPVVQGALDMSGAIGIAGAMTIGMTLSILVSQRRSR
ncbi:MAG: hypothetical protein DIU80_014885 [Chloroflexota bacterium]|mgnify:FL=1|nr:MAG: hypothetical protein DIU80_05065 [Chloroflexota bacterium]